MLQSPTFVSGAGRRLLLTDGYALIADVNYARRKGLLMSNIEELLHTFECHVMRMQAVSDIPVADLAYEIGLARNAILLYVLHTEAQLDLVTDTCKNIKELLVNGEHGVSSYNVIDMLNTAISVGSIGNG